MRIENNKNLMSEVTHFINVFTSSGNNKEIISKFKIECSYWFAHILYWRFIKEDDVFIVINRTHQFATSINGVVYDITGEIESNGWVKWTDISKEYRKNIEKYYYYK